MSFKQLVLAILTAITAVVVGLALLGSWQQPQIQSRLDLAQTNLALQAAEWTPPEEWEMEELPGGLIGEDVYKTAIEQYRESLETVRESLSETETKLQLSQLENLSPSNLSRVQQLQSAIDKQQALRDRLEVRLGILLASRDRVSDALQLWSNPIDRHATSSPDVPSEPLSDNATTAFVLAGLWRQPPQVVPNAEAQLQTQLSGWFRYRALEQFYQVQNQPNDLAILNQTEQKAARRTLVKLVVLTAISGVGLLLGTGLLLFLVGQRIVKGDESLLAKNKDVCWTVEWEWDTIAQVVVIGFFIVFFVSQVFAGSILFPLVYGLFGIDPSNLGSRWQAVSILGGYFLSAIAALSVLYLSLKPYFPLKPDWFRFSVPKGIGWGFAGYLAAVPLVLGVSLVNQEIWDGKGGSNPILEIALKSGDWIAITCFFITASILAPVFEEFIFRGFLLPSLTKYVPVWGAIVISSLVFALAHLSVSEVLPLATLGIVLGVIYARSRNLLAAMLMHGLWNSGTLLSLVILGSGS
ncbi:CPBP family intramembrane glutamic endopeptidase [Baaleninema simplex]|uniref:CPBP family intramembrane glutamic endopeptidase n=1 Tax=Baaleninema simplex TaxID=2862350 RepID=UPI000344B074|nr:type II CAAX endopeptidase family protein [Baaleninema simplex]